MTWPTPQPGLVIRYSYLWRREAQAGRDEGSKDRPCAVVIAHTDEAGQSKVYVVPISHTIPISGEAAIEIPAVVKQRLGLDGERSWVVLNEANVFNWPGPDLRQVPGVAPASVAYGFLPPRFFHVVRDRFLDLARVRQVGGVARTE